MQKEINQEEMSQAISSLLENFWITRKSHPDAFHFIRKNNKEVQKYFIDNFGYRLFTTINLIKLEKVPFSAEPWMGIKEFSEPLDYTIFIATLAYLEERSGDDLFLISMITEFIKDFVTNDVEVKWEVYKHRLSFIRVMKYVEKMQLVDVIEGDVYQYKDNEGVEVLYRPTMLSKYFLRFFTKPISEFETKEEMLMDKWIPDNAVPTPKEHLQMINRRLFFSPVVFKDQLTEGEKRYFAHQYFRIVDSVSEHTEFELEIYRNQILLVAEKRNAKLEQHPNAKGISDVALHFGSFLRKKLKDGEEMPNESIYMTEYEFEKVVGECQEFYGDGWSKEFREDYPEAIAGKLLLYLEEWGMLKNDKETYQVQLFPTIARSIGEYPSDYMFRKYFVKRVQEKKKSLSKLSIADFEMWVEEFNRTSTSGKLRGKEAKDAVSKFTTFKSDEGEIIIDIENVEKER